MDGKLAATAAAALAAGAALGFAISRAQTEAPPPPAAADAAAPARKKPARALSAALPSDADILRRRIEDLEAQNKDLAKRLAAESAKAAKAQTPPAAAGHLDREKIGIARALDKDERKAMTDALAQTYAEVKALHDEERRNLKLCAAMETGLSLEEAARLIMTADAIDNATTDFPSTMRDPTYNRPGR